MQWHFAFVLAFLLISNKCLTQELEENGQVPLDIIPDASSLNVSSSEGQPLWFLDLDDVDPYPGPPPWEGLEKGVLTHIDNITHLEEIMSTPHHPHYYFVYIYVPDSPFCDQMTDIIPALAPVFPNVTFLAVDISRHHRPPAKLHAVSFPSFFIFNGWEFVEKHSGMNRTFARLVSFIEAHTGVEPDPVHVLSGPQLPPLQHVPPSPILMTLACVALGTVSGRFLLGWCSQRSRPRPRRTHHKTE
eukprot:TRINITY_DN6251_c0_g1_i3.p1 TRINITY_DN6251_c0_g1~~TRINITY_DN6251_c0_g1_i3.p1  ORF type:complete len:245 (+),score=45.58 TRINITY_DN6251_c0_g1_i3:96-830(+)